MQTNSQIKNQSIVGIQAGTSVNNRTNSFRNKTNIYSYSNKNSNDNRKYSKQQVNNGEMLKKVVPGNSSYANMTNRGKKVCIFGASIAQRINLRQLNRCVEDKTIIKACYPGATVSKATYYMKPPIEEEKLDIVLLNIGTNNLTKERQTEEETVGEILLMVNECRNHGVNEIFVSGITVRHAYTNELNNINRMLRQKAGNSYTFIDNSNIEIRTSFASKRY